ncbi:hypothetical protein KUTeg_015342 [Tegillarca granosa]|uniref:Methyltransferase FkbM domain-containing protein n=1 Tax=Tegillarca granosa TaxID=220873 RepID=A0ABQ9EVD4_TEGGR|nr:hypothetical protein KUTeg_015342 [Tegillarca granosa]
MCDSGKNSDFRQSVYSSANRILNVNATDCASTSCNCVYSYQNKWEVNTEVCKGCFKFLKTRLKTRFGNTPIYVYDPKNDVFVSKSIIAKGEFDAEKIGQLLDYLTSDPNLNFIDIGANLGVFSLTVAKSGRKVLAIEALYKNVQRLCMSIRDGGLQSNLKVIYNAVSDKTGVVVNLRVDENNMGGTFVDLDAENTKKIKKENNLKIGGTYGSVTTFTLDNLLELDDIKYFKNVVIKIDIEGFEYKAILGSERFFDNVKIKAVFMEWVFHKGKESGKGIIEFMLKRNFVPYSDNGKNILNTSESDKWELNIIWKRKE